MTERYGEHRDVTNNERRLRTYRRRGLCLALAVDLTLPAGGCIADSCGKPGNSASRLAACCRPTTTATRALEIYRMNDVEENVNVSRVKHGCMLQTVMQSHRASSSHRPALESRRRRWPTRDCSGCCWRCASAATRCTSPAATPARTNTRACAHVRHAHAYSIDCTSGALHLNSGEILLVQHKTSKLTSCDHLTFSDKYW